MSIRPMGPSQAGLAGAYSPLAGPTSFTVDTTDGNGNPTQITEHYGTTTVVTAVTYNADGSVHTEVVTVNGVQVSSKTYAYSSGALTGAA